jgi:hypothetical protein
VLPQVIAKGNIHSGIIAGKLNGVIPAHTPTGWRIENASTPVPTSSVFDRLAVLDSDQLCQFVEVLHDQFVKAKHDPRPPQWRQRRPTGQRSLRRGNRAIDVGGAGQPNFADLLPNSGIENRPGARRLSLDIVAVDPVCERFHGSTPLSAAWSAWTGQNRPIEVPTAQIRLL